MTEYKTNDIILSAALVVHGNKLVKIEVAGSRGTFFFEDIKVGFFEDYELSKCLVEPVAFNNAIKRLTTSVKRMTQPR